jgi:uncharacterized protein (TIGR00255 family)
MIKSMSGHGRATVASEQLRITVEVRSVNHRFCRVSVRLPGELMALEERARRQVQECVQRGKVDVTVSFAGASGGSVHLDHPTATAWVRELRDLADRNGLDDSLTVADVLQLPGVLAGGGAVSVDDSTVELLAAVLGDALTAFDEMRSREGADLAKDLSGRAALMRGSIEEIAEAAESLPGRVRDQLRQRISDLLSEAGAEVSEERIVQEAAYYADRADVTEEIVRLRSHLDKVDELLGSDEAVGRTLEFVTQEIHRELNTIGSKTKDLDVAETIVALKAELERLREQVQNIE